MLVGWCAPGSSDMVVSVVYNKEILFGNRIAAVSIVHV